MKGSTNFLQYRGQLVKYLTVREAKHMIANAFQLVRATSVVFGLSGFVMYFTVHLYNQVVLGADEVYNEFSDGMLPPKLGVIQLPVSQRLPQGIFGWSWLAPHLPAE